MQGGSPEREAEERARVMAVQAAAELVQERRKGVGKLRNYVFLLEGNLEAWVRGRGVGQVARVRVEDDDVVSRAEGGQIR